MDVYAVVVNGGSYIVDINVGWELECGGWYKDSDLIYSAVNGFAGRRFETPHYIT